MTLEQKIFDELGIEEENRAKPEYKALIIQYKELASKFPTASIWLTGDVGTYVKGKVVGSTKDLSAVEEKLAEDIDNDEEESSSKPKRKGVFIEGSRRGYGPDQVEGDTITVGELIKILGNFDPTAKIFIRNDRGYTYGEITGSSIHSGMYNDEGMDELDESKKPNTNKPVLTPDEIFDIVDTGLRHSGDSVAFQAWDRVFIIDPENITFKPDNIHIAAFKGNEVTAEDIFKDESGFYYCEACGEEVNVTLTDDGHVKTIEVVKGE